MLKASSIMLNGELLQRIGAQLRAKSEDVYLLFRLLLATGDIAHRLSVMTVREMKEYIRKNRMLLSDGLVELLGEHAEFLKDSDYFFTGHRSKDHSRPLHKRSYEELILETGRNHGVENLSVKMISRSYYYQYLRVHNYVFSELKIMMKRRGRYVKDLSAFLDWCDLTQAEYEDDEKKHVFPDLIGLRSQIDNVIEKLQMQKGKFISGEYNYEDVLETIQMLEAV